MAVVEVKGSTYHMNDNLVKKWDKIKDGKLSKMDEDRVYVSDGRERTGKSVFTMQQVAYIDDNIIEDEKNGKVLPRIPIGNAKSWDVDSEWRREVMKRYKEGTLLPRITFSSKETLKAIRENKSSDHRTICILFDEAFRGMSSKGVLSKENKTLVQVLMEMGQNNLLLWVVSPSFYLLELYPAMLRSNALFHVKKDKKSSKRMVRIFNFKKKAQLYQIGLRKGWGYPLPTRQRANFYNIYPGGKEFEWRYRLKKQLSLRESEKEPKKEDAKWKKERDLIIKGMYSEINSLRKLSSKLEEYGMNLSPNQIGVIVRGKPPSDEDEPILDELDPILDENE